MMMSEPKSWSKCLPIELWPARDQDAWKAALERGDLLDHGGVASGWSLPTQQKAAAGYGRYLYFLLRRGEINSLAGPAERITREWVSAYHAELQHTNRGHTIHNRIQELGDAMRALVPEDDWRWILRGAGRLRASTIPVHDKRARLRPIEELVAEGLQLIDEAESNQGLSALGRALQYRDGLIVVFLGFHLLRLRNLAELEVGRHIVKVGDQLILRLFKTKGGQTYEGPVHPTVAAQLGRYLHHHRQVLLRQRGRWYAPPGDALWISKHGSRCSEDTFENIVRKRTGAGGRPPLSPHLFRSCAATSVAVNAPGSVDIIPAILIHGSPKTGERYYNLASSLQASRAHNALLDELRQDLARAGRQSRKQQPPEGAI
jgi:integrase